MALNLVRDIGTLESWPCSHPAAPLSGYPVRFGDETGVALTDESGGQPANPTGYTSVDSGNKVWNLSVKGANDSGNTAVAAGDALFYVDADIGDGSGFLSKKSSGRFFGFARGAVGSGLTATIPVKHVPSPGAGTLGAGTVGNSNLADGAVGADELADSLATGHIPLDITTARIISANAIQNTVEGGVPDGNTAPILARVNGATDKALRLTWAASSSVELQFAPVAKPADLNAALPLEVHLMMAKDTNTDNTVTVDVQIFDGVGDTEAGAATAALAAAALAEYSAAIAAADLADPPGFLNISLIPGTHTTDAIYLYAAWIEYQRI